MPVIVFAVSCVGRGFVMSRSYIRGILLMFILSVLFNGTDVEARSIKKKELGVSLGSE
jgi:hypothetical protein